MRKRAWWIGVVLVPAVALASWLGLSQKRAAPQRGAVQSVPDRARAQIAQPARSAASGRAGEDDRNAGPRAREPSPAQALHEVEALVAQGKIGAARDLAELYLACIPPGPEASRIQSLTGVHPHR